MEKNQFKYKTIFSFWEPQGAMTPYLKLCKQTWERHLSDYDIIFLDYSNLSQYLPTDMLDLETLKQARLNVQKDAIMVGVLQAHGGTFMDADTIVLKDIAPLISRLNETELVMFNTHLAFVAARSESHILGLWLEEIQRRLRALKDQRNSEEELSWDFFGNSILADVMDEMIYRSGYAGKFQQYVLDSGMQAIQDSIKDKVSDPAGMKAAIYNCLVSLRNKKRNVLFQVLFRNYLTMLDRLEYGFIPEADFFRTRSMSPKEKYTRFWFGNNGQMEHVFLKNQLLIGLHNTWTPQWYKDLSSQEVMEHDCLLSRTLKHLIAF